MIRRSTAALLAGLMFAAGLVSSPAAGPDLLVDGCVVRFPTAVPEILDTDTHECSARVTGLSVAANGDLVIYHDPIAEVMTCSAVVDETLAARGIIVGASAGLITTVIRFYSTRTGGVVRADGVEIRGSSANIFVTWLSVPVLT